MTKHRAGCLSALKAKQIFVAEHFDESRSMKTQLNISDTLHDMRGALQIISGFIRWINPSDLPTDGQALHKVSCHGVAKMDACLEKLSALIGHNDHA